MKKIGIVFDSSCGKSKEELKAKNSFAIPLLITVNNDEYNANFDITSKEIVERMSKDKEINIKTSSPINQNIINTFKEALEEYEKVIFIGISKEFSGTINAVSQVVKGENDFVDRVFIYEESLFSAPWTGYYFNDIIDFANNAETIEEVFEKLDQYNKNLIGFLVPGDIYWFYKGGRISKNQYLGANLLKIKPILVIKKGMISKREMHITRSEKKAVKKIFDLVQKQINAFKEKGIEDIQFAVLDGFNQEKLDFTFKSLLEHFNLKEEEVVTLTIGAEQSAHLGPDSFGVTVIPKWKN